MADTTEVMESSETIQKIDVTPSQDGGVLKEVSYLTYVFQSIIILKFFFSSNCSSYIF